MTEAQHSSYQAEGAAAEALSDKLVAFTTAKVAATAANALLAQRTTELETAWANFATKNGDFKLVMLVAPEGFTPPTPPA